MTCRQRNYVEDEPLGHKGSSFSPQASPNKGLMVGLGLSTWPPLSRRVACLLPAAAFAPGPKKASLSRRQTAGVLTTVAMGILTPGVNCRRTELVHSLQ